MTALAHPLAPAPGRRAHLRAVPSAPASVAPEGDSFATVLPFLAPSRLGRPEGPAPVRGPGVRRPVSVRSAHRVVAPAAAPALAAAVERRAEAAPLRLTVRGRRVLALLAIAAAGVVGAAVGIAAESSGPAASVTTVTVAPGESLWVVAAAATPHGADVRDTMSEIIELNALSGSNLAAGQVLTVPDHH